MDYAAEMSWFEAERKNKGYRAIAHMDMSNPLNRPDKGRVSNTVCVATMIDDNTKIWAYRDEQTRREKLGFFKPMKVGYPTHIKYDPQRGFAKPIDYSGITKEIAGMSKD